MRELRCYNVVLMSCYIMFAGYTGGDASHIYSALQHVVLSYLFLEVLVLSMGFGSVFECNNASPP